jgi:hypothetical protein
MKPDIEKLMDDDDEEAGYGQVNADTDETL